MVRKILMVCLGNICRSPIAEAVMQDTINNAELSDQWVVDSAAITREHQGNPPDSRALNIMKKHNLPYSNRARQIKKDDFNDFDYIFGMDEHNIRDLERIAPKNCIAKILLLGDFGLEEIDRIIEDPYYQNGEAGFERAYQQSVKACAAFLKDVTDGKI